MAHHVRQTHSEANAMRLFLLLISLTASSYATTLDSIQESARIIDASGAPLSGGQVCFQALGTSGSTPITFHTSGSSRPGLIRAESLCWASNAFNLDLFNPGVGAPTLIQAEPTEPSNPPVAGWPRPFRGAAVVGVDSYGALIPGPVVNILDYGAKGNGSFDNSQAFAAALLALPATGGEIDLPCGSFYVGSTWVISGSNGPVNVRGQFGCSIIAATGIPAVEATGYRNIHFENLTFAESNANGNPSTVGLSVVNAAEVGGQNLRFIGPSAFHTNLGSGLQITGSTCGTWVNIAASGWHYGVSTVPSANESTCQQFIGGFLSQNNWGAYILDSEVNLSSMAIYDNVMGGVYCGVQCYLTDQGMHYENGQYGAAYDVHISAGRYQSINSAFNSHPVVADGPQSAIVIIGAVGNLVNNQATGGAYHCYYGFPAGPYGGGISGTGSCVYQDWENYTVHNRPGNYNMAPGGALTVTGHVISSSTVTATGFVAGSRPGVTATVTCPPGKHLTGITIVGGIVTATPGCK